MTLVMTPVESQQKATASRRTQPAHAVAWAATDVMTLPTIARPHQRYFWDPGGDPKNGQYFAFALNKSVSQSSVPVRPALVAGTGNQLYRVDLRLLAPKPEDYSRLHTILEKMDVTEPYFHIIQTITSVKIKQKIVDVDGEFVLIEVPRYQHTDGKSYTHKWVKRNSIVSKDAVQAAVFAIHAGKEKCQILSAATASNNPIMRMDWFVTKALTTLDGGLYYQFLNVEKNPKNGTAQAAFLAKFGADEELVKKLDATTRGALFRSNVAGGRPRMIEMFYGVATRPAAGSNIVTMTHDIQAGDVDPKTDPIRNLLGFKDRAREIITVRKNGLLAYGLFNAEGGRVDSVPDNIAKDHTIPAPFDARLQPGISCIRCHGPHDGYQPFQNDVRHMLSRLKNAPRLNVFDDTGSNTSVSETLDKIAGMYALNEQEPLRIARNQYALAVYRATGGLKVPEAHAGVSKMHGDYYYAGITPQIACRELGFDVSEENSVQLFNQILPPLPPNNLGFSPEDPIIGALRTWTPKHVISISRFQWEHVYADALTRVLAQQALEKAQEANR